MQRLYLFASRRISLRFRRRKKKNSGEEPTPLFLFYQNCNIKFRKVKSLGFCAHKKNRIRNIWRLLKREEKTDDIPLFFFSWNSPTASFELLSSSKPSHCKGATPKGTHFPELCGTTF
ncbi:hypothetical protein CEXT_544001 [Caerostris extrusa]|uniref:Uncharacterized protein n=1 Tax=Caerostris extrusa TaxID=172846 RepID=A0AAV4SIF9_CAEEX|nr:hypothetical protein CEXT_544001 [Caerostris extrusa]